MTYFDPRWLSQGWPDDVLVDAYSTFGSTKHPIWIDETHIWQDIMEPVKVSAERTEWLNRIADRPAITDGAFRPDRVLYTWPMILKRARGTFEDQLFRAHGPIVREYSRLPDCDLCETMWPCDNAQEILDHFGLTQHDFDFRQEDNDVK